MSNVDEFAAEQRFYSSMPASTATGNNLADFVPQLHDTIIGSSTTWSGEHHPPAFVLERGHFSLEVRHQLDCLVDSSKPLHHVRNCSESFLGACVSAVASCQ